MKLPVFPVRLLAALVLALPLVLLGGCATMTDEESDLPWNTPQSWEGSPMIPGLGSH